MDIQAYRVAVRIALDDQISRQMMQVSRDALELNKKFVQMAKNINSVTSAANKAATAFERMNNAIKNQFSGATRDANGYATAIRSVSEQAAKAQTAIKNLPAPTSSGAAPYLALGAAAGVTSSGGGRNYGGGGGGNYMGLPSPSGSGGSSGWNGWKNGIPPGGWGGGRQPPNGGGQRDDSGRGAHGNGMANLATAYFGYEFLNSASLKGIEYERELARLRQMGLNNAQISNAQNYVESTDVVNTSRLDRMRIFTDAQGSFRQSGLSAEKALDAAKMMMPILAKYEVASGMLSGDSHAAATANMRDLNKIVEIMGGQSDTKRASDVVDAVFKASQASGRLVDERQLKQFVAYGSSATNHQTIRSIMGGLEPIIAEMGGSTTAVGLRTAYTRTNGMMSLPPKLLIKEMQRLGMTDKTGKKQTDQLAELQATDAIGYAQEMMKRYKSRGITRSIDIERENSIIFGTNGAKIYNRIMAQMGTIEHSLEAYDRSTSTNSVLNDPNNHALMSRQALDKSWEGLQLSLAQEGGLLDKFTRVIDTVTKGVNTITMAMRNHPGLANTATDIALGVTALAGVSGAFWVMKHATGALMGPLKFLVGSKGFPLLGDTIGALPNIVTMAIAGVLAANATEIYNRIQAMREGKPYDQLLTQTQENKDKEENARRNWNKNNPGQPYIGSRIWDLDGIPAKPGVSKASQFPEVPSKQPITMNITVQSILDGKKIGEHVTKYQTREATKAPSGTSAFDSSMLMTYPGQVSAASTN